jgi:hypothetical protein
LHEFVQSNQSAAPGSLAMVDLFDLEEHKRRFTANGLHLLRQVVDVRCPYFDRQMLALAAELPPVYRSQDKPLVKYAVHRLAPGLAAVPWQRSGLPLTASACNTYLHLGVKFMEQKIDMFLEKNFERTPPPTRPSVMIDYDGMLRSSPDLQKLLTSYLIGGGSEGSGLFRRESLQALIDHHLSGKGNHAEMIGRLLTVEIWHRLFVRGERVLSAGDLDQSNIAWRKAA